MPTFSPKQAGAKAPSTSTSPATSGPGSPSDTSASPATSIDHDASAPAWAHKFDDGWKMIGELFRGQFRQPASGPFKDTEERDWWLVRGNIARMSVALEKQDWRGLVFAMEAFLKDLGVTFNAEQMKAFGRAVTLAAETLPLMSGTPETASAALPKTLAKE